MITQEFIQSIAPNCHISQELTDAFNKLLPTFGINTNNRIAMFLAQFSHETMGMFRFEENLMYTTTQGLLATFPSHFKDINDAAGYVKQPIRIANRVYANRDGNGNEFSGDGWRYHGRGGFQLTGKANYAAFEAAYPDSKASTVPENLVTPYYIVLSACWFWNQHNLNKFADAKDVVGSTRVINGGENGLPDRQNLFNLILTKLG